MNPEDRADVDQNKPAVLVVDDEEVVRSVCQRMLERDTAFVHTAPDAMRALKMLASQDYPIVLCDLQMPVMNGIEFLDAVQRQYGSSRIIIMTGYATVESAIEAMKKGAYDFLLKPLNAEQMRMVVRRCWKNIRAEEKNAVLQDIINKQRELKEKKDKFIAITSHEMRTPVSTIKGFIDILTGEEAQELSEGEKEEFLKIIARCADELEQVVTEMYDIRLSQKDLLQLSLEPVRPARLLAEVLEEFSPRLNKRRIHLRNETAWDELELIGDSLKIKRIIVALVENAIKFTPDGGEVQVEWARQGDSAVFSVKDTGIGIEEEEIPRIFDTFYEAQDTTYHSSSKTKFKGGGPGLGLPIARNFAEAHGGSIKVTSEPGKGSDFRLILPLIQN